MLKYFLKRLLWIIPTVLGVTLIVMLLLEFTPGDPARQLLGNFATEEDIAMMYDLAARENSRIPRDLDDIMMYSEAGEMARFALRMTKKGVVSEDDWRRFIHYIKTKEAIDDD